MKIEKDRETTEKRLLTAVGEIVEESGLESLGINAVAQRAGVSKDVDIPLFRIIGRFDSPIYHTARLLGKYSDRDSREE